MKRVLLLIYGCNLDHSNISFLEKDRLSRFEVEWDYAPCKLNDKRDVLFQYDVYDVNLEKNRKCSGRWLSKYLIDEHQLNAFEYSLSKLNTGMYIRCNPNIRGHIEVTVNDLEYSAGILGTEDNKTRIFLIDEESENNEMIRSKLHLLPIEMQLLTIDTGFSYEERKLKVKEWIEQILRVIVS
ncbi:hypothetical protein [Psychrobacillus sp. FSL H8-0487]|uniref:hypothetical protein n=1 Tax=Psychrobacillus sp. FSL H8-0487 TaxID=2921391 RepID=UPI0030FB7E2A